MIANPSYAVTIDEGLAVPHEPLISEDNWVEANVRLIEEYCLPSDTRRSQCNRTAFCGVSCLGRAADSARSFCEPGLASADLVRTVVPA
jgi:hypothetical protein